MILCLLEKVDNISFFSFRKSNYFKSAEMSKYLDFMLPITQFRPIIILRPIELRTAEGNKSLFKFSNVYVRRLGGQNYVEM